jgi:hypothetical protein
MHRVEAVWLSLNRYRYLIRGCTFCSGRTDAGHLVEIDFTRLDGAVGDMARFPPTCTAPKSRTAGLTASFPSPARAIVARVNKRASNRPFCGMPGKAGLLSARMQRGRSRGFSAASGISWPSQSENPEIARPLDFGENEGQKRDGPKGQVEAWTKVQ